MNRYTTKDGDTLELVSIYNYGLAGYEGLISSANPALQSPLIAGLNLNIPDKPGALSVGADSISNVDDDQVSIAIDNKIFSFWDEVTITRTIDSVDHFDFGSPFEPSSHPLREAFRPFMYRGLKIFVGKNRLFTGTLVDSNPNLAETSTISASGYSLPGVLNDCNAPISAFPLEFNSMNLKQIAEAMCKPFGIAVKFLSNPGAIFNEVIMNDYQQVAPKEDDKILPYLASLAQQRKQIIASDEMGNLVFRESAKTGNPVAKIQQGESPVLSVTPNLNPQEYYSHVTGIDPVDLGDNGEAYSAKNTKMPAGVLRPYTFSANHCGDVSLMDAVKYKLGLMFANAISYDLAVDTWKDQNGKLWIPNTTLLLKAPRAMIYNYYEFLIKEVVLTKSITGKTAKLTLVMPGAYSGEIPKGLPWDE